MSQYRENSSFENSISAQNKKFLEENDKYDVCFVFPTEDVDSYSGGGSTSKTFTRKGAETALKIVQTFGRENVEMFLGESKSKIFLLLRSSLDRLKNYADLHDFQFLADPIGLKDRCDIGWAANEPEYGTPEIEKLHFDVDRPDIVKFSPFEHIYLKYEYEDAFASLYAIAREESTPFSDCKRVGIIHRILEEPEEDGGVGLHLNQLLNDGICKAIFAIHHPKKIQSLKSEWFNYANFFPWQQPTQLIREYFGEAISLYYLFTGMCIHAILSSSINIHKYIHNLIILILLLLCRIFLQVVGSASNSGPRMGNRCRNKATIKLPNCPILLLIHSDLGRGYARVLETHRELRSALCGHVELRGQGAGEGRVYWRRRSKFNREKNTVLSREKTQKVVTYFLWVDLFIMPRSCRHDCSYLLHPQHHRCSQSNRKQQRVYHCIHLKRSSNHLISIHIHRIFVDQINRC